MADQDQIREEMNAEAWRPMKSARRTGEYAVAGSDSISITLRASTIGISDPEPSCRRKVPGSAERQKCDGYAIGVGLTGYGCEYDVVERLTDVEIVDILGHTVGLRVYSAFNVL
jgi:hypothetical protein